MKRTAHVLPLAVLHLLAALPLASAQSSDVEELKSMVRAMQKTIAEKNARIAALEKQQAAPKQKPAAKPATSGRSVTVAGMDVPVSDLPASATPKERSAIKDADTFADLQQAAPRANNTP